MRALLCTTISQWLLALWAWLCRLKTTASEAVWSPSGRPLGGTIYDSVRDDASPRAFSIAMPTADDVDPLVQHARAIRARRWFAQSSVTHHTSRIDPEKLIEAETYLDRAEERCQRFAA